MTRITNNPRRYRSKLREQQAEETRALILDAAGKVIAGGLASVSIPAVAREAGVSVPTVYRHFGSKEGLLDAIYPHVLRRSGLDRLPPPRSIEELRAGTRAYIERVESFDELARAAMASPGSEEVRARSMPERLAIFRRIADTVEPKLADEDRDRLVRLMVVLSTSSSLRTWRNHLGASVDETADDIDWIVRAAIAASRKAP
ncbi:MAG TPA: TetR/AcrR family transcriptional regulator [Candidatus Limnocylindria bacterium]|nr:TetR/AcrR family transcriptional regulator [Candidatus Limnocylindria bacterium]